MVVFGLRRPKDSFLSGQMPTQERRRQEAEEPPPRLDGHCCSSARGPDQKAETLYFAKAKEQRILASLSRSHLIRSACNPFSFLALTILSSVANPFVIGTGSFVVVGWFRSGWLYELFPFSFFRSAPPRIAGLHCGLLCFAEVGQVARSSEFNSRALGCYKGNIYFL